MKEQPEYITRLDTSEPGLFVLRLNTHVTAADYDMIEERLTKEILKFAPGSSVLLLSPEFDPITMPSDEIMARLGWVRKVDVK